MKFTLNQKIGLGFLVLVFTYGALGYVSLKNLERSREITNKNLLINQPALILLNEFKLLIVNSTNFSGTWVTIDITANPDKIALKEIHESGYEAIKSKVQSNVQQWSDQVEIDSINSILSRFEDVMQQQASIMKALPDIDAYGDFLVRVDAESTLENIEYSNGLIFTDLNVLLAKLKDRVGRQNQEMLISFRSIRYSNIFLSILAVIVGVVVTLSILRAVRLEEQKNAVTAERDAVQEQKDIIEEKNQEIIESINYAKRIQTTILPTREVLERQLENIFVFYRPRDIVSGDFYWCVNHKSKNLVWIAAADCTGHGVPGAFVSFVCHKALTECVNDRAITEPAKVLDATTELVEEAFGKEVTEDVKDGMDIALCKIDLANKTVEFAGAHNPLCLVKDGELSEFSGDKQPIGAYEFRKPFTNHQQAIEDGTMLYLFSDGFLDQFGGPKSKRYMSKHFKAFLTSISDLPIEEQHKKTEAELDQWMGEEQQLDDILVIGIRV